MKSEHPRLDLLLDMGHDPLTVFTSPSYDNAIVGTNSDGGVVYDYNKMVECLMEEDGMEYDDAVDFIDYNPIRTIPYMHPSPSVIFPIDDYMDDSEVERHYVFNAKEERERVVQWIKTWFEMNGPGCNAVIGLSGGKDSTIVAALCAEALGKDRVIGVALPDHGQTLNGADLIAEHLGIKFMVMPIENITGSFYGLLENGKTWSEQSQQNIPPRIRMTMLYAISQTFNGRVADTCNLSENYIGYCTIFGDCAGAFSPLGKLTVSEVYAIGDEMGLPYEWVHKTPDDGLPHSSPDEEKLGFTYEALDKYIRENVEPEPETKEKIDRMHKTSQFKRDTVRISTYTPIVWV